MACLCDFCSTPNAGWRYPARSFIGYVAPGVVGKSVGDWAACHECHQLIISGNHVGLTERCVTTFIARHPGIGVVKTELGRILANCTRTSSRIVLVYHRRSYEVRWRVLPPRILKGGRK